MVKACFPNAIGVVDRFHVMQEFTRRLTKVRRSSVKLSCNQLFLDVFKVVDHTLPGLVSTAD